MADEEKSSEAPGEGQEEAGGEEKGATAKEEVSGGEAAGAGGEEVAASEEEGEGDGGEKAASVVEGQKEEETKDERSKSVVEFIEGDLGTVADAAAFGAERSLSKTAGDSEAPKRAKSAMGDVVASAVGRKSSASSGKHGKESEKPEKRRKSTAQDTEHVPTEEDEEKLEEYIFAMSGINIHEDDEIEMEEEEEEEGDDEHRSSRFSEFIYEYEREIPEFEDKGKTATIRVADMPDEMQQDAVNCAAHALETYEHEVDAAAFIKLEFDKKYETSWHCVVGREFGSYITHEIKHFVYFYLDEIGILLFRSG